jgi:hypothetical protein
MSTTENWTLTLDPQSADPTTVTQLSADEFRRALYAVMTGDTSTVEELTAKTHEAPLRIAA